jgi:hypothetical protein
MRLIDDLREHFVLLTCLIACLLVWHFKEVLGIEGTLEETIFIEIITVLIIFVYFLFCVCCIEIELIDADEPLKEKSGSKFLEIPLTRNELDSRTHNFDIEITLNSKLKFMKFLFGLLVNEEELNHLFIQLYWKPKNALQIEANKVYSSLIISDNYPLIQFNCLFPNQFNKYSMKVSCTPASPEYVTIEMFLRKHRNVPVSLKCRFLYYLINIKKTKGKITIYEKSTSTGSAKI